MSKISPLVLAALMLVAVLPAHAGLAKRERKALAEIADQPATGIEPHAVINDSGGSWDAASFHDRVTIVNFWATWCPPCLEEMPVLQDAHAKWAARGLRVFGVTTLFDGDERPEEEMSEIRAALERAGVAYPVLITDGQDDWQPYRVGGLPVTVLVDRNGLPLDYALGMKGLRRILDRAEELLAESP